MNVISIYVYCYVIDLLPHFLTQIVTSRKNATTESLNVMHAKEDGADQSDHL